MAARSISVFSWNLNGIRAAAKKGLGDWVSQTEPDVLGVQEVRASAEQVPDGLASEAYQAHFVAAERKGYSGVGLWAKKRPGVRCQLDGLSIDGVLPLGSKRKTTAPKDSFDAEGRLHLLRLGELLIVNGYFPNGNGKNRDNSRVPYKLEFYERVRAFLEPELQAGRPILVMGDWNTAHQECDLARPRQNEGTSGFLPEERAGFQQWFDAGWVDTFRQFKPAPVAPEVAPGKRRPVPQPTGDYTWWSQRAGVRAKNIGWRIDYILASPSVLPHLRDAKIHPDVLGSDHCPISVELAPAVLKG